MKPPKPHTKADGFGRALSMASPRVDEVRSEFRRLNTTEARLALVQTWLGQLSYALDFSWPVIFECGRLVKEHETYREHGFDSFEAWWTDTMGPAFTTLEELELAHRFVEIVAPRLRGAPLSEVRAELELASHGGAREGAGNVGASSAEEHRARLNGTMFQGDHGKPETYGQSKGGNRSSYLTARLEREADPQRAEEPEKSERARELLDAIREGTTTPNAAAVEMGWRKRKPTVTLDEHPDRAAARLVERFGHEWCRDLVAALDAAVHREEER